MEIKNIEGLSKEQLKQMVQQGGRFVMFKYVVSVVVLTHRNTSNIYFIPFGTSTLKHHIGHTALTGLMGWWGIPWGPIYSIGALYTNFSGGTDVTQEVSNHLGLNDHAGYNIPGTNPSATTQSGGYNIPGSNNQQGNSSTPPQNNDPNRGGYNIPR